MAAGFFGGALGQLGLGQLGLLLRGGFFDALACLGLALALQTHRFGALGFFLLGLTQRHRQLLGLCPRFLCRAGFFAGIFGLLRRLLLRRLPLLFQPRALPTCLSQKLCLLRDLAPRYRRGAFFWLAAVLQVFG